MERPRPDFVVYRMDRPLIVDTPSGTPSDANVQSHGVEPSNVASAADPIFFDWNTSPTTTSCT